MNVFLREMKSSWKSLLIWSISILVLVASGMSKFGTMNASGQSINQLVADMPRSLQALLGLGSLDLTKAIGYYGVLFLYLLLMAGIHALLLGANLIAKEERDKTAEFLLTKPIPRWKIVSAKLLAALVNILVFYLVTLVSSIQVVAYYNKNGSETGHVVLLLTGMLLLQLLFLFLGTGMAAISKRPKSAAGAGTVVLLLTFILSIMIDLNSKLDGLKFLTPFKYYEAKTVLKDGALDPEFVGLSLVLTLLLGLATYFFFNKRDMSV